MVISGQLRFILLQHHQGPVTVDRIATFLTSLGLVVSKRRILRLLTGDVATFAAEADDVLRTGLSSAPWITVDDTGARHRARNGVTTQIGNDRFTFFGTSFSKSRRNFLELLRAGHRDYVVNAGALAYMRARNLTGEVVQKLDEHGQRIFADEATWSAHLDRLLARLHARKDELLHVLDRPEIPLHTNGAENDIRCHVTKRKISGSTWSDHGRQARDTFLGLLKTCQKLGISFFE